MTETRRSELITLLTEAAAVEHSLACQYLFAAVSLKQRTDEGLSEDQLTDVVGWERQILSVARQEMEHLGLVINLLNAVGGAPQLLHPEFPYTTHLFGGEMALEPFSVETIKKFVCFERPVDIRPDDAFCRVAPDTPPGVDYTTIAALYERVGSALDAADAGPERLFIGPTSAQVGGTVLGTDFPRIGALGGGYDIFMVPVTDIASAHRVLRRIVEEGEGSPGDHEYSHFRRFRQILSELEAAGDAFQPARNVVSNPSRLAITAGGSPTITNPDAIAVMEVFDAAYRTMLLTLTRLFAHTDESPHELGVLAGVAFFPLMTMAIRPLAELLTELPAQLPDDGSRAGPSFDPTGTITFLPHRHAAWTVLDEELRALAALGQAAARRSALPSRMAYIAHSLQLIARRFGVGMSITKAPC